MPQGLLGENSTEKEKGRTALATERLLEHNEGS